MNADTLEVKADLVDTIKRLRIATGGRGKYWQAAKRLLRLALAIDTATGARKVTLQRKLDALARISQGGPA